MPLQSQSRVRLLSFSHFLDDLNQGAVPVLLPFFIERHHLTYAAAAGLVFAANSASSVTQPAFGYLSDRVPLPWSVPVGLALAGLGVALACNAPTYATIFACVMLSGVGVAMFHPEAARLVKSSSGARRATAMSTFALGGNLGFATGPLITTPLVTTFGLRSGLLLFIPTAILSTFLWFILRRPKKTFEVAAEGAGPASVASPPAAPPKDDWRSFGILTSGIVARSIVFFGFNTFVPLYWVHRFGASKETASNALALLLIMAAVGTYFGGRIADRYGHRTIVLVALAVLGPLVLGLALSPHIALATAMLVPTGLLLSAPFSVMVVMGHDYLPNHIGLASGITIGLAVTVGGMFAPVLGLLADHYGLGVVLYVIAFVPGLAACVMTRLPKPARVGHPA